MSISKMETLKRPSNY